MDIILHTNMDIFMATYIKEINTWDKGEVRVADDFLCLFSKHGLVTWVKTDGFSR